MSRRLRFTDGFDAIATGGSIQSAGWKYSIAATGVIQLAIDPGKQSTGPTAGNALNMLNSSNQGLCMTKLLDAQNVWDITCDLKLNIGAVRTTPKPLFRFEAGPNKVGGGIYIPNEFCQATVAIEPNGRLSFWNGGEGIFSDLGFALGITSRAMIPGQWVSVEIVAQFTGLGAGFDCYMDDVLVFTLRSGLHNSLNPGLPDRLTFYGEGYTLDNLVYADGAADADAPNVLTTLGPCRIVTLHPAADAQPPQWTRNGGTSDAAQVADGVPDSDSTYTGVPVAGAQVDLFTFPTCPCFGLIYGLGVNASARYTAGSGALSLLARPNPRASAAAVGASQPLTVGYSTVQAVSDGPPARLGRYVAADITGGWFGMRADAGAPRVTQYTIELVTALRNLPFTCGGLGSYSF